MRIGLDFDNTIVRYDALFHRLAAERHGMPVDVEPRKPAVRAWFWAQPDGNTPWTELQGQVYGERIEEAELTPGLEAFLERCRGQGHEITVVSHKTQYPALGPRVDLRVAARGFLKGRGLLDPARTGLDAARLFFCPTREAKVAAIAREDLALFVDDLPEVFVEPGFPAATRRVLYDPSGLQSPPPGVTQARDWEEIGDLIAGLES